MPNPDTIRLFLVVISFIFLIGMLKRPFYGVVSYLIIMMVRPGIFYPVLGSLRIELLVGVMIIIVMALSPERLKRIHISTEPINKWMFILFAVMVISMIQAFDFKTSWDWMFEFSKVFLFFIMIITLIDNERDVEIFLWVFGILTFSIAYDSVYNYIYGDIVKSSGGGRIDYAVTSGGMGSGHVALANLTLQGMPILWYLGIYNKKKALKVVATVFFLVCLYSVVISGSRGGFVGLVTLFICLTVFAKRRSPLIVFGILVFVSIPLFSVSGYMDYISTIFDFDKLSAGSRITGLRHGIEILVKKPLLGVGPGCYPVARKAWFHWGLWAHNHYGELFGELGLMGAIVWFAFLKSYLQKAWHSLKSLGNGSSRKNIFYAILVATFVRLVLGMGTHSVYYFFWYMIAGIVVVEDRLLQGISIKYNESK